MWANFDSRYQHGSITLFKLDHAPPRWASFRRNQCGGLDSFAGDLEVGCKNFCGSCLELEGAADWTGGITLRGCLVVACNRSVTRRIASVAPSALASF